MQRRAGRLSLSPKPSELHGPNVGGEERCVHQTKENARVSRLPSVFSLAFSAHHYRYPMPLAPSQPSVPCSPRPRPGHASIGTRYPETSEMITARRVPTGRCTSLFDGPDPVRSALRWMRTGHNTGRSCLRRRKVATIEAMVAMTRVVLSICECALGIGKGNAGPRGGGLEAERG